MVDKQRPFNKYFHRANELADVLAKTGQHLVDRFEEIRQNNIKLFKENEALTNELYWLKNRPEIVALLEQDKKDEAAYVAKIVEEDT